jgi:RNA polymerase sigma-70 factor (ECF subfamily)
MSPDSPLPGAVRSSWHAFLESYEPHRGELYRYCRHLTRSPWDAEDLVQDVLARAFVTLGQMGTAPPSPRAWLFRVASNLWIDRVRQRRREDLTSTPTEPEAPETDARGAREAAGTLLAELSPQERAAVVLKDAVGLSLEEVADALSTTVGAVKTALHRARGKLVEPRDEPTRAPAPHVLDAFCAAFNAGDIDRVTALLLDNASVEVVGASTLHGRETGRRVLGGMLFGVERMARAENDPGLDGAEFRGVLPTPPRAELRAFRDGWVVLHWYAHVDGDAVRAITQLDVDGDHVARLRNHFYEPELLRDVCSELGVPVRTNGYRWWPRAQ